MGTIRLNIPVISITTIIAIEKEGEKNHLLILKTRDLFKKIRDTEGTFHAKMGTIKDRWNGPKRSRRY